MTPQGLLNHYRAEAAKLHPPRTAGEKATSPKGVEFETVSGCDENGRAALAWMVLNPQLCFEAVFAP